MSIKIDDDLPRFVTIDAGQKAYAVRMQSVLGDAVTALCCCIFSLSSPTKWG
jgi:hypothetical protein